MVGTCPWKSCHEGRKRDHVGNRSAAILYGNPGFCICWNRIDAADLFCCDLCGSGTYRTGRWCCSSRLLCADGRFCGHVLQGKQMGRPCFSGNRNFHAPDGKYRQKSKDLDRSDRNICYHRTYCNLSVQASDERNCCILRNGYLRFCRSDRCVYRMDE